RAAPPSSGRADASIRALSAWSRAASRRVGSPMDPLARLLVADGSRGGRIRAARGMGARRVRASRDRLLRWAWPHRYGTGLPGRTGRGSPPGGGLLRAGALRAAGRGDTLAAPLCPALRLRAGHPPTVG